MESLGWALNHDRGPFPGSMALSEKGAVTDQRVEVQESWWVAQGISRKVREKGITVARALKVLTTTAWNIWGEREGRVGGDVEQVLRWLGGSLTALHITKSRGSFL